MVASVLSCFSLCLCLPCQKTGPCPTTLACGVGTSAAFSRASLSPCWLAVVSVESCGAAGFRWLLSLALTLSTESGSSTSLALSRGALCSDPGFFSVLLVVVATDSCGLEEGPPSGFAPALGLCVNSGCRFCLEPSRPSSSSACSARRTPRARRPRAPRAEWVAGVRDVLQLSVS